MFLVLLLRLKPDERPISRRPEEAELTNEHESAHCWGLPPAWVKPFRGNLSASQGEQTRLEGFPDRVVQEEC